MKAKIFGNVNYIGLIVIILTFIFIYFWYFFIYIPKKESQLEQKAFRILKEYGTNMFDKHRYYENHFKNYGLYYSIRSLEDSGFIAKKTSVEIEKRFLKDSNDIENVIKDLPSQSHFKIDLLGSLNTFRQFNRNYRRFRSKNEYIPQSFF